MGCIVSNGAYIKHTVVGLMQSFPRVSGGLGQLAHLALQVVLQAHLAYQVDLGSKCAVTRVEYVQEATKSVAIYRFVSLPFASQPQL